MNWKDHLGPIVTTVIGGILIATFTAMIGGVNRRIDALGAGLQRTNERIDALGAELRAEIRTEIRHTNERIDALGAELRTELRRTNDRIDRTNDRIDRVLEILQAPDGADAR